MPTLEGSQLLRFQPNRFPFLMIDRVTDYAPGRYARGYKNFTNNEWFFPVHFKGHPNVPGVLQVEAMAQMITVALTTIDGLEGETTRFLNCAAKFRKEVLPGDRMDIDTEIVSWRRGICTGTAICSVDGKTVSEGNLVVSVPKELLRFSPK